jgi:hypothetical protein
VSAPLPPPPRDPAGSAPTRPDTSGVGRQAHGAEPSLASPPALPARPGLHGKALRNLVIVLVLLVTLIVTALVAASIDSGGPFLIRPGSPSPVDTF